MIITLSGNSGTGKSTVAQQLKKTLNYELFSVGSFIRAEADKRSLSINDFHNTIDAVDIQNIIKEKFFEIRKRDGVILDSRTAWIFIPESYKVYLQASYYVCAQRLVKDESRIEFMNMDISAVARKLSLDDETEKTYFSERFKVRYDSPENYDLFLSTDDLNLSDVHNIILQNISNRK